MPTFGVDLGALEALDLDGVLDCFFLSREAVGVVAMLLRAVDDITALFQRTKGWIEGVDIDCRLNWCIDRPVAWSSGRVVGSVVSKDEDWMRTPLSKGGIVLVP